MFYSSADDSLIFKFTNDLKRANAPSLEHAQQWQHRTARSRQGAAPARRLESRAGMHDPDKCETHNDCRQCFHIMNAGES